MANAQSKNNLYTELEYSPSEYTPRVQMLSNIDISFRRIADALDRLIPIKTSEDGKSAVQKG